MSGFDDIEEKLMKEQEKRHIPNNPQKTTRTKQTPTSSSNFQVILFEQEDYSLTVKTVGKNYKYTLLKSGEVVDEHTFNKKPGDCNKDTQFINRFVKQLEGEVKTIDKGLKYNNKQILSVFMKQLRELQKQIDHYEKNREGILSQKLKEKEKERLQEARKNYEKLNRLLKESHTSIIDYIQLCSTYFVNGDHKNVLIGILCHLSTYFKREPLWFMLVGKTTAGKSFIERACKSLLPEDAFREGKMTEAALHRATLEEGENYVDGKIMMLGDLGGKNDFKQLDLLLNRYKELSTEGKVTVEKTSDTPDDESGERGTTKFTVKGFCSVCFTTIHSEDIEEQFENRGRIIEPETTEEQVEKYELYNNGDYKKQVDKIKEKYVNQLLHDYIDYIRIDSTNIQVFNPYLKCLFNWLKGDKYYNRSIGQYKKLVETVTLLNYTNRERVKNNEGTEFIVSTPEDNAIITQLFVPSFGLSPIAIRLFNKIIDWFFKAVEWKNGIKEIKKDCTVEEYDKSAELELIDYQDGEYKTTDFTSIFTVVEVKRKAKRTTSLKDVNVSGIIGNLEQKGYIIASDVKVKGTRRNIYQLNYFEKIHNRKIEFNKKNISWYMKEVVPRTYGDLEYTPPTPPREIKKIFNDEKLRKCSIGELEVAEWFLKK